MKENKIIANFSSFIDAVQLMLHGVERVVALLIKDLVIASMQNKSCPVNLNT